MSTTERRSQQLIGMDEWLVPEPAATESRPRRDSGTRRAEVADLGDFARTRRAARRRMHQEERRVVIRGTRVLRGAVRPASGGWCDDALLELDSAC